MLLLLVAPESALERVAAVLGHLEERGMFIRGAREDLSCLWSKNEGGEQGVFIESVGGSADAWLG